MYRTIFITILTVIITALPQYSFAVDTHKYVGQREVGGNYYGMQGSSSRNIYGFQTSPRRINFYGFKINGHSTKQKGKKVTRSAKPGSRAFGR